MARGALLVNLAGRLAGSQLGALPRDATQFEAEWSACDVASAVARIASRFGDRRALVRAMAEQLAVGRGEPLTPALTEIVALLVGPKPLTKPAIERAKKSLVYPVSRINEHRSQAARSLLDALDKKNDQAAWLAAGSIVRAAEEASSKDGARTNRDLARAIKDAVPMPAWGDVSRALRAAKK